MDVLVPLVDILRVLGKEKVTKMLGRLVFVSLI